MVGDMNPRLLPLRVCVAGRRQRPEVRAVEGVEERLPRARPLWEGARMEGVELLAKGHVGFLQGEACPVSEGGRTWRSTIGTAVSTFAVSRA